MHSFIILCRIGKTYASVWLLTCLKWVQELQKEGKTVALRSQHEKLTTGTNVYVVDTLGLWVPSSSLTFHFLGVYPFWRWTCTFCLWTFPITDLSYTGYHFILIIISSTPDAYLVKSKSCPGSSSIILKIRDWLESCHSF